MKLDNVPLPAEAVVDLDLDLPLDASVQQTGATDALSRRRMRGWTSVRRVVRNRRVELPVVPTGSVADGQIDPRLAARLDAVAAGSEPVFREVAAALDLARFRNHVDVGGGNGLLSCIFAASEPRLTSRSCDYPEISAIADRRIRALGLATRVRAEALDPYAAAFPAADLITLSHLLYDWSAQRRKLLIAKAWQALVPTGVLVAIETFVDADRPRGVAHVDTSSGMLIEGGDVFDFTGADLLSWAYKAGFRRCDVLKLAGGSRAIVAAR